MSAWENQTIRVSSGRLNTVNDTVIGGGPSIGSLSRYAGQLGKTVTYTGDQIGQLYKSSVGTLYPGRYRYVKFRSTDDDSPTYAIGQLVFIDTTVSQWWNAYQVTRDENLSSVDNAIQVAGVYIGGPEPGNYGFIQDMGLATVAYRAVLTVAAAIGARVYAAATGDLGSDQGKADLLTTDSTSAANARYLGVATTLPVANSTALVQLMIRNAWALS